MSATSPWVYIGPYDAVDVRLPSGRKVTVGRGQTVDLLANEAAAVADLPGWGPVSTTSAIVKERKQ